MKTRNFAFAALLALTSAAATAQGYIPDPGLPSPGSVPYQGPLPGSLNQNQYLPTSQPGGYVHPGIVPGVQQQPAYAQAPGGIDCGTYRHSATRFRAGVNEIDPNSGFHRR